MVLVYEQANDSARGLDALDRWDAVLGLGWILTLGRSRRRVTASRAALAPSFPAI